MMELEGGGVNGRRRRKEVGFNFSFNLIFILMLMVVIEMEGRAEGMWCVARSDAREEALQRGLDYACAAGADCNSIKQTGLCFLPNTLQAHASYAFNSFFQRSHMAPSSCDFSGTATLAKTDPSYGSCVYPASPSTAGSITSTGSTPTTDPYGSASPVTPTTTSPATADGGADTGAGLNPGAMTPPITTTTDSRASPPLWSSPSNILPFEMLLFLLHLLAVF